MYIMKLRTLRSSQKGFTLLEILLVVAAIAILAGIVIVAINPGKQLGDTRNAQRRSDVTTILNAVYQYSVDNNGNLPANVAVSADCTLATNEICKAGGTCTGLIDLPELVLNQKYLVGIPNDPSTSTTNGAGYHIAKNANGRVVVCAPGAEQGATITVTR
jgi:type IV pilus assembly protein PilA